MFLHDHITIPMDKPTIVLSVLATFLVAYVLLKRAKSGEDSSDTPAVALGRFRTRRTRRRKRDCSNVNIESPNFARCQMELGAGRTVLPGNPVNVAHNINTGFVTDTYDHLGSSAYPPKSSNRRRARQPWENPFKLKMKSGQLGAAVSPSAMGASMDEILQSTKKAVETTVESNTGGQLNLLHPLVQS